MIAKFRGFCTGCRKPIEIGEQIKYNEEEEAWQHQECSEDMGTIVHDLKTDICPECFQHKAISGACGCG